jgi:hypothetical protein
VGQAEVGRLEERARPEIVDDDRVVPARQRGDLGEIGGLGKAGEREVRRVHPEHR